MLTCSSCCVTVNFHWGIRTFVRIFTNFFNFGKFVKIRDFFAEVTNSRSMDATEID